MVKELLLALLILFSLTFVYAQNETETCPKVYDFIIEHYNAYDNKLEFTDDDFDLLQMQTTTLEEDLKNHIIYYEDLCDQELPFINYNNKWPGEEKVVEVKDQSIKEGFDKFLDTLKEDSVKIIIGIIIAILLIWIISKYS